MCEISKFKKGDRIVAAKPLMRNKQEWDSKER